MNHTHVQPARETDPGFSFSEGKPVKAPLKVWLAIGAVLVAGVGAWTRAEVAREHDARRIDKLELEQAQVFAMVREVRESLIRIEANTAAMQRQLDRGGR